MRLPITNSINNLPRNLSKCIRNYCQSPFFYVMPKRYQDCFYLANASLYDTSNWFLHSSYEAVYPKLLIDVKEKMPTLGDKEAGQKVRDIIELLDQCNSVIDVRFPFKRESGKWEVIRGFRAHYGLYSGFTPCLGGLRIHEDITRDQMKGFSVLSMYRLASMGINFSGAFGGIKINPKNYSQKDLKTIVDCYITELYKKGYCGNGVDVQEPDINTGCNEMSWIADQFSKNNVQNHFKENSASIGKHVVNGGFETFANAGSEAAYFGMDYFLNNEKIVKRVGIDKGIADKTFIIQGLGKMGSTLCRLLTKAGAKCVGVKEVDGHLYNSNGINVDELLEYKQQKGSILNYSVAKPGTDFEIFKSPCDILILAAGQKALGCYLVKDVQAKVIVEASYSPVTLTSAKTLFHMSKLVIPDIYICSGSAIAGYLEYWKCQDKKQQNGKIIDFFQNVLNTMSNESVLQVVNGSVTQKISELHMDDHEVLPYVLAHVLSERGLDIMETAEEHNLGLDIRSAAYINGIKNIFKSVLSSNF